MYILKDWKHLLGLDGLSEDLLLNHFALYESYVNNVNALDAKLRDLLAKDHGPTPEFAELKRRFGWEWNGMRLHELYFENLTKKQVHTEGSTLHQKVVAQFGSAEQWEKEFRAIAAMRGIGWVVLTFDAASDTLYNVWIGEHDGGHLAGTTPLLVMDVFEHAFALDYGIKRAVYTEVFFGAIDWQVVSDRFYRLRTK
jgi:Fe-Mn family superoxide dismutase